MLTFPKWYQQWLVDCDYEPSQQVQDAMKDAWNGAMEAMKEAETDAVTARGRAENDDTRGWYKAPDGRIRYVSHMRVIWSEMATGQAWQRVNAPSEKVMANDEKIKQWANEQGFQTWSRDHAAVLRNLVAWLNSQAVEHSVAADGACSRCGERKTKIRPAEVVCEWCGTPHR